MTADAVRRPISAAVTLLLAFLLSFLLLHALPGDPLDRLDAPQIPAEQAARNRRALGLDRPLPLQFVTTLASYASGDLGMSFSRRRQVIDVFAEAIPHTAALGAAAIALAYGLGIPLALGLMLLSVRWKRRLDRLLIMLATIPRFWFGVMLILLFHSLAGWLPASHAFPPGGGTWSDYLRHLILPALTLGIPGAAVVCRYQFYTMELTARAPHVRAARATGASGFLLLARHVLRPSLAPTVALLGLDLQVIVSGAIVVEVVFAWPGLGRLTAEAVTLADYPLALAASILSALVVVVGRSLAELLAHGFDPRLGADGTGAPAR